MPSPAPLPPDPTITDICPPGVTSTPNLVEVYPPPPPPLANPDSPNAAKLLNDLAPPPPPTQNTSIFFTPFGTVNVEELSIKKSGNYFPLHLIMQIPDAPS